MARTVFIGNSLPQCVDDIMQGLKSIDDVLCIVSDARAPSSAAIFNRYWRSIWAKKYQNRSDELRTAIETLWGRSVQPWNFGIEVSLSSPHTWIELVLDPDAPALGAAELRKRARVEVWDNARGLLIGLDIIEAVIDYATGTVARNDIACIVSDTTCSCGELFEICWQEAWYKRLFTWMPRTDLYEHFKAYIWPRVVQPRLSGFEFSLEGRPSAWIKANMMQRI